MDLSSGNMITLVPMVLLQLAGAFIATVTLKNNAADPVGDFCIGIINGRKEWNIDRLGCFGNHRSQITFYTFSRFQKHAGVRYLLTFLIHAVNLYRTGTGIFWRQ